VLQLGSVFGPQRQSAFTAAGGSLGWRIGTLLVSVVAVTDERNRRRQRFTACTGVDVAHLDQAAGIPDVSRVALGPGNRPLRHTRG
jgi:hypothetical protein